MHALLKADRANPAASRSCRSVPHEEICPTNDTSKYDVREI